MIHAKRDTPMRCPGFRGALAGSVLAAALGGIVSVAWVSRAPLEPLRLITRWSLERHGARFVAPGSARLQSSLNDCGPTALADFLELAGLPVPPSDVLRRLTATSATGATLGALEMAAIGQGLRVFSVHWDPAELSRLPLPSLVWVERRHFVVVARREHLDSVEVHDPAVGRYRMEVTHFVRLWSGEALVLLDSISPRRTSDAPSALRPHRPRGTRATRSRTTEV